MTWFSGLAQQVYGLPWELALRLIAAAALGAFVGWEREAGGHDAGLRTNILVAMGSCLFTLLSIFGFPDNGGQAGGQATVGRDSARIAAQIVSGIGFLGAGAVFRDGSGVRGLTTAATIWLVAAIGMAAGAGSYFLAAATTVVTLVVLRALLPLSQRLAGRNTDRGQGS
jgi:putative Mg2+ transporter-C (MgtC) family protein